MDTEAGTHRKHEHVQAEAEVGAASPQPGIASDPQKPAEARGLSP